MRCYCPRLTEEVAEARIAQTQPCSATCGRTTARMEAAWLPPETQSTPGTHPLTPAPTLIDLGSGVVKGSQRATLRGSEAPRIRVLPSECQGLEGLPDLQLASKTTMLLGLGNKDGCSGPSGMAQWRGPVAWPSGAGGPLGRQRVSSAV